MGIREQVDAAVAAKGGESPQTYADRRLLEIANAIDTIKTWVIVFGVVFVLGMIFTVLSLISAASRY
jgi:hypothetical protein